MPTEPPARAFAQRCRPVTETTARALAPIDCAVSFTDIAGMTRFVQRLGERSSAHWSALLGLDRPSCARLIGDGGVTRLRFGNEFCERLLPSRALVRRALRCAAQAGLAFGLVLPMLSDRGVERTDHLLGEMPDGTEITVNDWDLMRRIGQRFPKLRPTAGRLLSKMLKAPSAAPRKPTGSAPKWANPSFCLLLQRLDTRRLELDIPPCPDDLDLRVPGLRITAHAPFGFASTGRICRIGNLRQPLIRKFAANRGCSRECLIYLTRITRRAGLAAPPDTYQRGNTLFYRYGAAASNALTAAIGAGLVDRLVIPGDWHESHCADVPPP